MYVPEAFATDDPQRIAALVRQHPFATLISVGPDGPLVSHLPLLAEPGPSGTLADGRLLGHLACANPHTSLLASVPALAIFHGPHAYVSPRWYASPGVPTWNYAAVHIAGQSRLIDAVEDKLAILEDLTAHFEQRETNPWTLADAGPRVSQLAKAIAAFEISILSVTAKFKLSQNRPAADREQVRSALAEVNPELAHLMN